MPVNVAWHQENDIIYSRFYDEITLEDIEEAGQLINQLAANVNHKVHQIVDITTAKNFPAEISQFALVMLSLRNVQKQGVTVLVGSSGLARFVGKMVAQLAGVKIQMVASIDEADSVLHHLFAA